MRTTLQLDEDLMREVKARAARAGTTMTAFIEAALRRAIQPARGTTPERTTIPVFTPRVPGLRPGVDLDSNAALLDLLEREGDSAVQTG